MPKRKPIRAQWKSPPSGWPRRHRNRYFRFCLDFSKNSMDLWHAAQAVFPPLLDILGDHPVQLTAFRLKPETWGTDIPWRQTNQCNLDTELSSICLESEWSRIIACAESPDFSLHAHRGGGSHRHLVWSLSDANSSHRTRGLELLLATRHIRSADRVRLRALIHSFFEISKAIPGARGGYGDVSIFSAAHFMDDYSPEEGSDRWLSNGLIHSDYEFNIPSVAGPKWITFLTAQHLAALGGLSALRERAVETERLAETSRNPKRPSPLKAINIEAAGTGAYITCAEPAAVAESSHYSWPRPELPLAAMWLYHELATAGLLAHARTDRLPAYLARMEEIRNREPDRAPSRQRSEPAPARLSPEALRSLITKNPPSSLQLESSRDDKPPGFTLNDNCACFRLRAKSPEEGLTVYTGPSDSDPDSAPVVLVGSLKPPRAALFFDPRIHGHDGAQSPHAPESARPIGRLKQLVCPKCKGRHFHVRAIFEYPEDLDFTDPAARNQFSWFWLRTNCLYCRWSGTTADVECA